MFLESEFYANMVSAPWALGQEMTLTYICWTSVINLVINTKHCTTDLIWTCYRGTDFTNAVLLNLFSQRS
jgi:hypothetical protein